jgi:hypothetical protein
MQFVDQRLLTAALPKGAAMRREMIVAIIVVLLGAPLRDGNTFPLSGDQTVLPPGTELNEEALDKPRELFRSEAQGGAKSYMVNLGDLTWSRPPRWHELRNLSCQRRRKRQALYPRHVHPARKFRYHRSPV